MIAHQFIVEIKACVAAIAQRLVDDFGLIPVISGEIEFYIRGIAKESFPDAFTNEIEQACRDAGIAMLNLQHERGEEQYEIALDYTKDLDALLNQTLLLQTVVKKVCSAHGMHADFAAKPRDDEPGSGLHMHVHLEDGGGVNRFTRDADDVYSSELMQAIAGMLKLLPAAMPIFAPHVESYKRFQPKLNAPVNVSWGPNNRTVAIRLPNKALDDKHVEHRVAGADANPGMVMAAILAGAHYGLQEKLRPGEAIFGDASDATYQLEAFPEDLEAALRLMEQSAILDGYLGHALLQDYLRAVRYPQAF